MKKILALVLAFALVLVPMTMSVSAADYDDAATLTVGTDVTAAAGDNCVLNVTAATEATDGIFGAQVDIALGDLVFVSCTAVENESYTLDTATNTVKYRDAAAVGETLPGTLFSITVQVPSDAAAAATYTPVLSNEMLCKESEELFNVTATAGTITVESDAPEASLDSNIGFKSVAVAIADTVGVYYTINSTILDTYAKVEIVATKTKYDSSYMTYQAEPVVLAVDDTYKTYGFISATLTGVGMYEMGLNVDAYIKCYDADNNYVAYSATETYVPADLLKTLYNNNVSKTTSSKTKTKETAIKTCRIVTDLLNMGAEAENYFGSNPDSDLAKATRINDGWSQTWATASLGTLNTVNTSNWNANTSTLTSKANKVTTNVSMGVAPSISYTVKDTAGALDPSKLVLTVSYTTNYPSQAVVEETYSGDDWNEVLVSGNRFAFNCSFGKTALYDGNKTVTATLTYDGNTVMTSTYSVESYINANKTNASTGAVLTAIGKFGASCRTYFGTT